jgi:glycosyltransferase involved in cell wall biosynthesis
MEALERQLPAESHVDLLTTMPNRYGSFSAAASEFEETGSVSVRRIPLPSHQSGMRDQSKAFFAYARAVHAHVRNRKYDLIFATSSRLMTAVLGASIARSQGVCLYLDIRDIFVDTIQSMLPRRISFPIVGTFSLLERYAVRSASKVNLVSRGFEGYFVRRYPTQSFSYFLNGIDDMFFARGKGGVPATPPPHQYLVLYAGNLGEGQGLHVIMPALAKAMKGKAKFSIIGDGGCKSRLKIALENAGVDNVSLQDPVDRKALVELYQQADVLFLHLNDYDAFRKVLPSKIFEYAATGKPIWAGVAGYAAEFIKQEIENAEVFTPCDIDGAIRAFSQLQFKKIVRDAFVFKYDRQSIMQLMAKDIVSTVSS